MEKELFEKLQFIAEKYGKTSDLRTYVRNGNGMFLDEKNQKIKFNQTLDRKLGKKIAAEIITTMNKYGYISEIISEEKCTPIVFEYIIKYSK